MELINLRTLPLDTILLAAMLKTLRPVEIIENYSKRVVNFSKAQLSAQLASWISGARNSWYCRRRGRKVFR
jgi:hypothetical protein